MEKLITREEYMQDSNGLFDIYYSQFITESTIRFIRDEIGLKKLKESKCEHLNDLYKMDGLRGWIWDYTPINTQLTLEAKEGNSLSTHTCVGKVCAKKFISGELS